MFPSLTKYRFYTKIQTKLIVNHKLDKNMATISVDGRQMTIEFSPEDTILDSLCDLRTFLRHGMMAYAYMDITIILENQNKVQEGVFLALVDQVLKGKLTIQNQLED